MIVPDDEAHRADLLGHFRELAGWSVGLAEATDDEHTLFGTADAASFPGVVLPRRDGNGTTYYALADEGKTWRTLAPLLKAFVGVTVTDFVGRTTELRVDDPLEAWLATTGLIVARLTPGPDARRPRAARVLLRRLVDLTGRSEATERTVPRSTEQVLRDFELALAAGNRDAARAEIQFLRENYRLDALNLYFLDVQIDAELSTWATLAARPFFDDLCRTRRPPRVTAALTEALYWTAVEPAARDDGPSAGLARFRHELYGRVGTLLEVPPPRPTRPVATMFLLAALAGDAPDRAAIERLRIEAEHWTDDEGARFAPWLSLAPGPASPPLDPVSPASATAMRVSWATTLAELKAICADDAAPTVDRAVVAILAAVEIDSLDAFRAASRYVERLSADDRLRLLASRVVASHWSTIQRQLVDGQVPRDWFEWIKHLPSMSLEQARTWAERAVREWPVERHLRSAADATRLAEALEQVGSGNGEQSGLEYHRDAALPHLIGWIQEDPAWPNPAYLDLYLRIFDLLILSGIRSESLLDSVRNLLRGILDLHPSQDTYATLLRTLREDVIRELNGPIHLDTLIDLLEVTADAPCPDLDACRDLWGLTLGILAQYPARLGGARGALVRDLAATLGVELALDDRFPTAIAELPARIRLPARYRLALHTLTESVGRRVKAELEHRYEGLTVEVDDSVDRTPRLVTLARHADLFVVCWRSAKHAATDAIGAERSASLPTLQAPGKGSSSILAMVERYLDALPVTSAA